MTRGTTRGRFQGSSNSQCVCQRWQRQRLRRLTNAHFPRKVNANPAKEDDREVIERARNGDGESFNQLIALHQDNVRRFVSLRVSNREDAEDICQEVLIRGCSRLNTFQGRSTLRTWLLSIAKRAVSDFFRENRWSRIINAGQTVTTDEDTAGTCHGCDFVREICHARQRIEDCLRCVLRTLALEEQVAVLLADFLGCSDKETARILGKHVGALKHLLHNARASMDLASKGTCPLVRKTGDSFECAAGRASGWPNSTAFGTPHAISPGNRRQQAEDRALLSLREDLMRNIESLIHSNSTPAGLALLDLRTA